LTAVVDHTCVFDTLSQHQSAHEHVVEILVLLEYRSDEFLGLEAFVMLGYGFLEMLDSVETLEFLDLLARLVFCLLDA
jgi:hypothetical protein